MRDFLLLILISFSLFLSCSPDNIFEENKTNMAFSSDTITFDTVFTTIGSATKYVTIKNQTSNKILISSISLANKKTYFKLNIDGESTNEATNIELMPKDSMYIFIRINVDPQDKDNPVFIEDSIMVETNESIQSVKLNAYGQDINVLKSAFLETTDWDSKKPYLIMDSVYVLSNSTLTIEKGATIYCHKTAKIVVNGNIVVNGTIEAPVTFRGDRLDEIWEGYKYDYTTSQWTGITITPSKNVSSFNNCIIRNASIGLYVGDPYSDEMAIVNLQNTVIHNNEYAGVYAINSEMTFKNCQITNSGSYNVFLFAGGNYNFYHCTIANYFGLDQYTKRQETPCLTITNAVPVGNYTFYNPLKNANFYNCIIDGNIKNEIDFWVLDGVDFNFKFSNCAVKVFENIKEKFNDNFSNCYFNDSIKYLSLEEGKYNFQLDTNSLAINKGNMEYILGTTGIDTDIQGNSRTKDGLPDLGAYEFH